MTPLDVLFVAYGVPELTWQSMKHLLADSLVSGVPLRFILWDNAAGTADASTPLLPHLQRLGGIYVESDNVGVYRAINAAVSHTRSGQFMFASSDVAVFGGCLAWLIAARQQRPEVAWLGVTPADDYVLAADIEGMRETNNIDTNKFESHLCLLDWSTLLQKVGPFDERFFFTYGDTDYIERMRKAEVLFGRLGRPLCVHTRQGSRALLEADRITVLEGWDREAFFAKWNHDDEVMKRHKLPDEVGYTTFLEAARQRRSARSFL